MSDVIMLDNSHPQSYDAALAKFLGSIPAAVIFHQLTFWSGKSNRTDGWFWKSSVDLQDETGMTADQVRLAVKKLKDAGFIEVKVMRAYGAPTRHFKMSKALKIAVGPKKPPKKNPKPRFGVNPKSDLGSIPNPMSQNPKSNSLYKQSNTHTKEQIEKLKEMKKRYGFK